MQLTTYLENLMVLFTFIGILAAVLGFAVIVADFIDWWQARKEANQ